MTMKTGAAAEIWTMTCKFNERGERTGWERGAGGRARWTGEAVGSSGYGTMTVELQGFVA